MVAPETARSGEQPGAGSTTLFLAVELGLIGLLPDRPRRPRREAHAEAAELLLGGPYTAVFWVVVVGLGIVVPLFIQSLAVTHRIAHTPVAPLLVLLGGLALRFVIVYAGQYSHWPRRLRRRTRWQPPPPTSSDEAEAEDVPRGPRSRT